MAGLIVESSKPKSDQLNAADLIGRELVIKIVRVDIDLAKDQPATVHAETMDGKKMRPFKPCKNMQRVMIQGWGDDEKIYAGKYLRLFHDPKVKWGGQDVGGVRVNAMSNIKHDFTFNYRSSRTNVEPMKIAKLDVAAIADQPQVEIASQETLDAGASAAAGGVASYTAWKDSLPADVKATIKPYHAGWVKVAKAADEAATDIPIDNTTQEGPAL